MAMLAEGAASPRLARSGSSKPNIPPKPTRKPSGMDLGRVLELERQVEELKETLAKEREMISTYMDQHKVGFVPTVPPTPPTVGELLTERADLMIAVGNKEGALQILLKKSLEREKHHEEYTKMLKSTITEMKTDNFSEDKKLHYQFSTLRIEAAEAKLKQTMAEKELAIMKTWFEELNEQLQMSTKKVLDLEFKEVSKVRGKTVFSSPEQQERVVVEKIPDNLEAYSLTETVLEMQKLRKSEEELRTTLATKQRELDYFTRKAILMDGEFKVLNKEIKLLKDSMADCSCGSYKLKYSDIDSIKKEKEEQKQLYTEDNIQSKRTFRRTMDLTNEAGVPATEEESQIERDKLSRQSRSNSRNKLLPPITPRGGNNNSNNNNNTNEATSVSSPSHSFTDLSASGSGTPRNGPKLPLRANSTAIASLPLNNINNNPNNKDVLSPKSPRRASSPNLSANISSGASAPPVPMKSILSPKRNSSFTQRAKTTPRTEDIAAAFSDIFEDSGCVKAANMPDIPALMLKSHSSSSLDNK